MHQGYLFAPISPVHGGVHTYVQALGKLKIGDIANVEFGRSSNVELYLKKILRLKKVLRDIW